MFSNATSSGSSTPPSVPAAPELTSEDVRNLRARLMGTREEEQAFKIDRLQAQVNALMQTNQLLLAGSHNEALIHLNAKNDVLSAANELMHQNLEQTRQELARANFDKEQLLKNNRLLSEKSAQLYNANVLLTQAYTNLLNSLPLPLRVQYQQQILMQHQMQQIQMQMQMQMQQQMQQRVQQPMQQPPQSATPPHAQQSTATAARAAAPISATPALFKPIPQHVVAAVPVQPQTEARPGMNGAPNQNNP